MEAVLRDSPVTELASGGPLVIFSASETPTIVNGVGELRRRLMPFVSSYML
jgi:hypothetical protein